MKVFINLKLFLLKAVFQLILHINSLANEHAFFLLVVLFHILLDYLVQILVLKVMTISMLLQFLRALISILFQPLLRLLFEGAFLLLQPFLVYLILFSYKFMHITFIVLLFVLLEQALVIELHLFVFDLLLKIVLPQAHVSVIVSLDGVAEFFLGYLESLEELLLVELEHLGLFCSQRGHTFSV